MIVSPEVLHVVRQWIEKGENDLVVADRLLAEDDAQFAEAVCFHAQQCIEKYVKSVLALNDIDPPKTHDIDTIVGLLAKPEAAAMTLAERGRLTTYATVTRYPGEYTPVTLEEARAAVEIARRGRAGLRGLLPPEVLEGCR